MATIYLKLEYSFVISPYSSTADVQADLTQTFQGITYTNVTTGGLENVVWTHYNLGTGTFITTTTNGVPFPYQQTIPENPGLLTTLPGTSNEYLLGQAQIVGSSFDSSVFKQTAPMITYTTTYPDQYDATYHVGNDTYSLSIPEFVWEAFTITDQVPSISISDAPPVIEGKTGPLSATFTVTLSSASTDTITVDYATQDGTAKAGTDYTAESGTLTFAPGQTSATISVPIINHTLASETEAFNVVLSNPVDVGGSTPTISNATGTATLYSLFSTGADTVDFNNLRPIQQQAIAAGADTTHGLGGNDDVTLPNTGNATFYTGSTTSDTDYQVMGGSGNYTIFEGAGTETILINGDGSSNITAGGGSDTITINGNGNNNITAGSGGDTITTNGNGNNAVTIGSGNDIVTISGGGNNTVTDGGTQGVTITQFQGALDGTAVPTGTSASNSAVNSNVTGASVGSIGSASTYDYLEDITKSSSGNMTIGSFGIGKLDAQFTGNITFSGVGGALIIDGTALPTSTVYGFVPSDTIDLAGVPYNSSNEYTLLETSNNSVGLNNLLQVVTVGSSPLSLQFDPTQNFSGGFQLSSDGNGGTNISLNLTPVTGYSTSPIATGDSPPNPYGAICEIKGGTGFIIGPHTILTAAHVVNGITGDFNIYIGDSNGQNGKKIEASSSNIYVNPYYALFPLAQNDFAIINVTNDLSPYGAFQVLPDYLGGAVNITGYPSDLGKNGQQFNDIGTVTTAGLQNAFVEGTAVSYDGESGGPLWIYNGATAQAVGIVAGTSLTGTRLDVKLTSADAQRIYNLENIPILETPTDLPVESGHSVPMGIVVTPTDGNDIVLVTISGVPNFETITAGPGETVTRKGSSYTVTTRSPGTSISDLTITSSFKGKGAPVNNVSITATNITPGENATSSTATMAVQDPPAASSAGTLGNSELSSAGTISSPYRAISAWTNLANQIKALTVGDAALINQIPGSTAPSAVGSLTSTVTDPPAGNSNSGLGDVTHVHSIALLSQYMASSFVTPSDGHGGTMITYPPPNQQPLLTQPHA
jgi:hypothetical protein